MTPPTRDDDLRREAERRADAKLGFRTHALVYVLVNAGLAALNLLTSPGYLWFVWPLFGWGIGLAAHGFAVYASGGDRRERAVAAELAALSKARKVTPPPREPETTTPPDAL
ncbi:MAG: 2TM domain-containing protein [Caulobacteraceae bacterium]|nr:2TM domain-containing protein [Caulobacteraceae bacterium]